MKVTLLRVLAAPLGFIIVAALVLVFNRPTPAPYGSLSPKPSASAATVAALIDAHDCWVGSAPADMQGRLPGHVVVTRSGARLATYAGSRMVGRALDHAFKGKHPGLVVHAFCT